MNTMDTKTLAKCFLAGAKNLEAKKEWINELNVFPVPDGDTGTNMTMTIMSAANEVSNLQNPDMAQLAKAISSGSLRGARGNSGVILSQLLRGFTRVVANHDEIDVITLSEAIEKAVETAYKAVMKPKEGTILTVARGISDKALDLIGDVDDIQEYVRLLVEEGDAVLATTPELLPVLKQAGVVDSGGQGLMEVLRGAYDALCGKEVDYSFTAPKTSGVVKISAETEAEIKFGYCTEFIIVLNKPMTEDEEKEFKGFLEKLGDSIVLVADEEVTKVHVHTNTPGDALTEAQKYGVLEVAKIENMRTQHDELVAAAEASKNTLAEPEKDFGVVTVCAGEGIASLFRELGADNIVTGGQTMNPSTEDILTAINATPASTVLVFPNNKNIIMAAEQCAPLTEKKVIVIPTKTIPQGVSALINMDTYSQSEEELVAIATEAIESVHTALITYAARDSDFDGYEIKAGEYLGLLDGALLGSSSDITELLGTLASKLEELDPEFLTVYFGEDVAEDAAHSVSAALTEKLPDSEISTVNGGQPVYYYMISAE